MHTFKVKLQLMQSHQNPVYKKLVNYDATQWEMLLIFPDCVAEVEATCPRTGNTFKVALSLPGSWDRTRRRVLFFGCLLLVFATALGMGSIGMLVVMIRSIIDGSFVASPLLWLVLFLFLALSLGWGGLEKLSEAKRKCILSVDPSGCYDVISCERLS